MSNAELLSIASVAAIGLTSFGIALAVQRALLSALLQQMSRSSRRATTPPASS